MIINKEIIRWWIKALRSGEYKQTMGALRQEDKFCCLGVLCDLGTAGRWDYGFYKSALGGDSSVQLPASVREFVGIESEDMRALITMNDDSRSFSQIADYLERKYLGD